MTLPFKADKCVISPEYSIYLGKDQETGLCKGFAFVSYETKAEAEKAMGKINGLPYDHLILSCSWSGEYKRA